MHGDRPNTVAPGCPFIAATPVGNDAGVVACVSVSGALAGPASCVSLIYRTLRTNTTHEETRGHSPNLQ